MVVLPQVHLTPAYTSDNGITQYLVKGLQGILVQRELGKLLNLR